MEKKVSLARDVPEPQTVEGQENILGSYYYILSLFLSSLGICYCWR